MKKTIILLVLLLFVLVFGAQAADMRAGLIAGGSVQAESLNDTSFGGGCTYGGEFGFILGEVGLWPTLLVDLSWTENRMIMSSLNPGLGIEFNHLGIVAGAVLRATQDKNKPVTVEPIDAVFYDSSMGVGPFVEVSYLFNITEWLVLRSGLSADYVFQTEEDPDQFRVRAVICLHLRTKRF